METFLRLHGGACVSGLSSPHTARSPGGLRAGKRSLTARLSRAGTRASLPPSRGGFPLPTMIGIQFLQRPPAPGSGFNQELQPSPSAVVLGEAQMEPSHLLVPRGLLGKELWPRGEALWRRRSRPLPLGSVSSGWAKRRGQKIQGIRPTASRDQNGGLTLLWDRRTVVLSPARPPPAWKGSLARPAALVESVSGRMTQTRNHIGTAVWPCLRQKP